MAKKKSRVKKRFELRIDETLADKVDKSVSGSIVPISRNTWIIHAIAEKLKREKRKKDN